MTLPTSGAISLSSLQSEFGGSNPISLSEYYAGGSYVPSGTSGTNGAVPSSGTNSLSKYYGATSAPTIQLFNASMYPSAPDTTSARGTYSIRPDGTAWAIEASGGVAYSTLFLGNWCSAPSLTSNYEVYCNPTGGSSTPSGSYLWSQVNVNRDYFVNALAGASRDAYFTLQIRLIGTTTILASANVYISAISG